MESTMMTNDRMGKLARRTALAAAVVLETASAALAHPAGGGFNAPKPDADYLSSPSAFANLEKSPLPWPRSPNRTPPLRDLMPCKCPMRFASSASKSIERGGLWQTRMMRVLWGPAFQADSAGGLSL
jgi:hypothetical protein